MDAVEFEKGIKAVETAKSKTYAGPQQEELLRVLYKDFQSLTVGSWMEICNALSLSPRVDLPNLGQFWEVRRQLPNLRYETKGRKVCGTCRRGIRYWLGKRAQADGGTIAYYLARCSCLAGDKWTGIPLAEEVEKRDSFKGWIDRGIPEEVAAEARRKARGV